MVVCVHMSSSFLPTSHVGIHKILYSYDHVMCPRIGFRFHPVLFDLSIVLTLLSTKSGGRPNMQSFGKSRIQGSPNIFTSSPFQIDHIPCSTSLSLLVIHLAHPQDSLEPFGAFKKSQFKKLITFSIPTQNAYSISLNIHTIFVKRLIHWLSISVKPIPLYPSTMSCHSTSSNEFFVHLSFDSTKILSKAY